VPLAKLFVEGSLEIQVLSPILLGNPVLQQGGSKNVLKSRAWTERRENSVAAGYLRDRDFDFDPPSDLTKPTIDSTLNNTGIPFGWRWCRHEIENYFLEPALVSEAMGCTVAEVEDAVRQAATKIRYYEAARWTVGTVRRALPPHYELKTRPDGLNEIELPPALDSASVNTWASTSIDQHRGPIVAATDPEAVQISLNIYSARFDSTFIANLPNVLICFSGKDILAAMVDWLIVKSIPNPGSFRASMRDWIIANPVRTLDLLPEWRAMIYLVRA
jgi:hypothetical protein